MGNGGLQRRGYSRGHIHGAKRGLAGVCVLYGVRVYNRAHKSVARFAVNKAYNRQCGDEQAQGVGI